MGTLKKGEIVVVRLTKEKIIELLKEAIFLNISDLAHVDNADMVVSAQFFSANDTFPIIVFAAEDSGEDMLTFNFSELAKQIRVKKFDDDNILIHIPSDQISQYMPSDWKHKQELSFHNSRNEMWT